MGKYRESKGRKEDSRGKTRTAFRDLGGILSARSAMPGVRSSLLKWPGLSLCGLGCLMAIPHVAAQSFHEELERVLQADPRIAAADQRLAAAGEEVGVARGEFLPTVSLGADTGPERLDTPASRRLRGDDSRSDLTRRTASLVVTQNLFSGQRNQANLAVARLAEALVRLALADTRIVAIVGPRQSGKTVDRWLVLLEHMFLICRVRVWHNNRS